MTKIAKRSDLLFEELEQYEEQELTEILQQCLDGTHPGFGIYGPSAGEDPETVLWYILRSEEAPSQLKKAVRDLLEDIVFEHVRFLNRLARGEKETEEDRKHAERLEAVLRIIQKANTPEFKLLLTAAANTALVLGDQAIKHDTVYHIFAALQASGVDGSDANDRSLWGKVKKHEPLAALAFTSFIQMGAGDSLEILYDIYEGFGPESEYIDFGSLGKYLLTCQDEDLLISELQALIHFAPDKGAVQVFAKNVVPELCLPASIDPYKIEDFVNLAHHELQHQVVEDIKDTLLNLWNAQVGKPLALKSASFKVVTDRILINYWHQPRVGPSLLIADHVESNDRQEIEEGSGFSEESTNQQDNLKNAVDEIFSRK